MISDLLNAITKQLGTTFGTDYHYYVENVEQGLVKPCFTVDMLSPMMRSRSATDYDRTMPMVIHYFTSDKVNNKANSYIMAEDIVECLEYLNFKDCLLRGEDISWQMTEGVLQIFITYRFRTQKQSETLDNMNDVVIPEVNTQQ